MKKHIKQKAVKVLVMIYALTAFFTPIMPAYASGRLCH